MIANTEQTGGGRPANKTPADESDFKCMVDLLALYSDVENQLAELQVLVNRETLVTVDLFKKKYAKLQEALIEAETALEVIARKHPDWFADKKTVKTPYGAIALKQNPPKIVAENPELSIALIERDGERDPEIAAKEYIRQEKSLNLETLAGCTDEQLKRWRMSREQSDTFTVKAAKLDMGKAVKESAAKEGK